MRTQSVSSWFFTNARSHGLVLMTYLISVEAPFDESISVPFGRTESALPHAAAVPREHTLDFLVNVSQIVIVIVSNSAVAIHFPDAAAAALYFVSPASALQFLNRIRRCVLKEAKRPLAALAEHCFIKK